MVLESLANHVRCSALCIYLLPLSLLQAVYRVCTCACVCVYSRVNACVLCMTLFHVLMLTVGHDNTPRYICMLRMTLFRVLIAYSGS